MQLFDDTAAPHQLHFNAFGVEMRIATNLPELLDDIETMMPPGSRRRPRFDTEKRLAVVGDVENDIYSVYRYDGACIHDAPGRDYALLMLESQIHGHVALEAPNHVFVHAGAVGDGNRAIVIPGLSFSGKTTLVRALVEAGAAYYSDEFAVLDEAGLVHPYPRRLSVRQLLVGESTTITEPVVSTPVERLGGLAGVEPIPVGMVVVTHYRPGAEWHPREISGAARALALMKHAVPAQERPEQTMRYLTRAVSGASVFEGERGGADELAPRLLEALSAVA
jgi:hypothetical protein